MLALDGFRSHMSGPLVTSYVDANPELARHRLSRSESSLITAIGPVAAKMVWESAPADTRKLCLMVLDPAELLGRSDLCGIHLRVPVQEQFRLISQRMGPGTRIGVLYNPSENGRWILDAGVAVSLTDVMLVPIAVERTEDVAGALLSAAERIDALLFIPDSTVISETMVGYLVKNALLKGIAPVGYNSFFLETGAVMAFIIDYRKCGEAGADLAMEVLSGKRCHMQPPPFEVAWNEKAWDVVQRVRRARQEKRSIQEPVR